MKETRDKKTFAKLGYTLLDTAEIVIILNRLLSNYAVFSQKLRNYYWNIRGQDFFDIHNHFKNLHNKTFQDMDETAERILLFGQKPMSALKEYLQHTAIKESSTPGSSFEMVNKILSDIRILLENLEEGIAAAKEINDNGTEYMLKSFTYHLEKEHWMLTAWVQKGV